MSETIALSAPTFNGNELKYLQQCMESGWISSAGQFVEKLQEQIQHFCGTPYAVACINGTAALQVALRIVGVKPGDEVMVPTLTFIAPVNAVHYLGAHPIFMDCDDRFNVDPEKIIDFIKKETLFKKGKTYNKTSKRRVSAFLPVHVFGNAVNLESVLSLMKVRNIPIVEDASESLGTVYTRGLLAGKHTGTVGEIGCYSLNGNKIVTSGGGGLLVTKKKSWARKAEYLISQAKDDNVRFIHNEVGYNYRLSALHAAVGLAQLEKLEDYLKIKKDNYQFYKEHVAGIDGLSLATTPEYAENNHWMYALRINQRRYGVSKNELIKRFAHEEIEVRPVWHLNHLQKPYRQCRSYRIENALKLLESTLNLPCSVSLRRENIINIGRLLEQWKK